MKYTNIIGLGAIALIATTTFSGVMPGLATLPSRETAIAQADKQEAPIKLVLAAEKRTIIAIASGQNEWVALPSGTALRPSDVIRYVVTASNVSDRTIKNLVVNQPIPSGTTYILNSATLPDTAGAKVDFSIDGGKNYSATPTIPVKNENGEVVNVPAPESMYTNVRWNFGENLAAKTDSNASYQVRVR